ncbi:MAG: glycosyltransferase family 4 protein [Filifactoraceae bacterium]
MKKIKILSVTAQKPRDTGSGIYLSELVKGFSLLDIEQAVIFGGSKSETNECAFLNVKEYKVSFDSEELPFPVFGMSDNMPYKSSKYKDMDELSLSKFKAEFEKMLLKTDAEFTPDLIICHHLYLLTAMTVNILSHRKIVAICHGTCIRQLKEHSLEYDFIRTNIRHLNKIYALQKSQIESISSLFNIDQSKLVSIGMGYNKDIFFCSNEDKRENRLVYTGKLSPSKGVEYLIRAMEKVNMPMELYIVGEGNNKDFINRIKEISKSIEENTAHKIIFSGKISQTELSKLFRSSETFILPSFYEGLPLVIIEAIACGMKIIYSKIEGSFSWFLENFKELSLTGIELVGQMGDDGNVRFDEEMYIDNIANAIIKSKNGKYISQEEALDKLNWNNICVKILKEINKN